MSRIDEIRERLAKATQGKWELLERFAGNCIRTEVAANMGEPHCAVIVDTRLLPGEPTEQEGADAALIAHAPADIAHLLAEVERLTLDAARARGEAHQAEHAARRGWQAGTTHWDSCWREHRECAMDMIEDLAARLEQCDPPIMRLQDAAQALAQAEAERDALREAGGVLAEYVEHQRFSLARMTAIEAWRAALAASGGEE